MFEKLLSNPAALTLILVFSIPIVAIVGYYWSEAHKKHSKDD